MSDNPNFPEITMQSVVLKEFFASFPSKILQLIEQESNVICWTDNGTCISINLLNLSKHLNSEGSLFPFQSLFDFIKCLDSLGFQRAYIDKKPGVEKFFNPYFQKENPSSIALIKLRNWNDPNYLHGKSFRLMKSPLNFLQNLNQLGEKIPVSKLDFARLRLHLTLEKEKMNIEQKMNGGPPIYEEFYNDNIPNPSYLSSKEIAGYYGSVSVEQLRAAFPRYFPAYEEDEQTFDMSEIPVLDGNCAFDESVQIEELLQTLNGESDGPPEPKRAKMSDETSPRGDANLLAAEQELLLLTRNVDP